MAMDGANKPSERELAAYRLFDEAVMYCYSSALRAAAIIGVADHLTDGPKAATELAKATDTLPEPLYRVLRTLASRDIFREDENGKFHLTPMGEMLRSDVPGSGRAAVLMYTGKTFFSAHNEIVESLRTGQPSFDNVFGKSFFDYFKDVAPPEDFYVGMQSKSDPENSVLARSYEFPVGATVVDVGGGHGGLLLEVLRLNPSLRGVLFERGEHVMAGHRLGELSDDNRWEIATGDFFKEVPSGDVYLLKHVIHDWVDELSIPILKSCRRAMAPGGRVLILEAVIPSGNTQHPGKAWDMIVMAMVPGKQRTEKDFSELLRQADLQLTRVIDTGGCPISIVEAVAR